MSDQLIEKVGTASVIRLAINRPNALNALSSLLLDEVILELHMRLDLPTPNMLAAQVT